MSPSAAVPSPSATQRQVIVLDIDGTLTPRDVNVLEPRQDAAQAVNALVNKGYKIVYVTTRIPLYQSMLPDWLRQNGFPMGTLHLAKNSDERANAANYKARVLREYSSAGWRLAYAYGDSSSDFVAYAKAGMPQERVFALKRRKAGNCQEGVYRMCLEGWTEHLPFIESQIPPAM